MRNIFFMNINKSLVFLAFFMNLLLADSFLKQDSKNKNTFSSKDGNILSDVSFKKDSLNNKNLFYNHYIKDRPKGITRDFYIWQYLQLKDVTPKDVNKVYSLLSAKNPYTRTILKKLGVHEELPRELVCQKLGIKELLKQDAKCISLGIKLSSTPSYDKNTISLLLKKLDPSYKLKADVIRLLVSSNVKDSMFSSYPAAFVLAFNSLPKSTKIKLFSSIPVKNLERLIKQKNISFSSMIGGIILDSSYKGFHEALLKLDVKDSTHNTLFLLGINELRFGSKKKALNYFNLAHKKANDPFFKDRALFWQYQASKDEKYLKQLSKSSFVDIFSIYANQKLNVTPSYEIVYSIDDLIDSKASFDIQDPYAWQKIRGILLSKSNLVDLSTTLAKFTYVDSMPHLVFVLQKINKYKINYYIQPYSNLIEFKNNDEKSFVYSIAKQESHFLPALISRSFALGLMQIMPANIKPFAKSMGIKDIEYEDLFSPKVALSMGRYYINDLYKEYKNPLFVAYAYNGGPGFLRRLLSKKELFIKGREYEPWLSMELIPYEESRFYGMKIMANYFIYKEAFGEKINVEEILKKALIY